MEFQVEIANFAGPMDLLLHLVKSTKLDIYEIKMSEIIDSYLEYIHSLKELNIDISSSFLLMAATLVHIKSKKLIGKTTEEENLDDEFAITSEDELKERLIEYENYQKMTKEFQRLEEKRQEIYTKIPENLKDFQEVQTPINEEGLTAIDLWQALKEVDARFHYKEPKNTKITKKEISVESRKVWIRQKLEQVEKCNFLDLFEVPKKDYIIATFLAVLEMSKEKTIKLTQESAFTEIWIWRVQT